MGAERKRKQLLNYKEVRETPTVNQKKMPSANWNHIGLTYILVLIAILLVLVLVATYFTWHKAKPIHTKSKSNSSSKGRNNVSQETTQALASVPPPVLHVSKDIPFQFFDDEMNIEKQNEEEEEQGKEEDDLKRDDHKDILEDVKHQMRHYPNEERPLPAFSSSSSSSSSSSFSSIPNTPSKPPGTMYKFIVSNKLLPSLDDYDHPGYLVTYHPSCANLQQAFHSLKNDLGDNFTQNVSRHFDHKLQLRGFHIKTLSHSLQNALLAHPLIGDIHEDGFLSLSLPAHNQNESQSEKESKLRKLKSLTTQQIVSWSVVRVGGKSSSLQIGTKKSRDVNTSDKIAMFTLDSGIDVEHSDLNKGAWSRNFVQGQDPSIVTDEHGHGTHVAGIIGAQDNGIGTVGTCPGIPIHALKVLDRNGIGTLSSILEGFNYCFELALKHPEKRFIANVSVGTSDVVPLLDASVIRASDKITIVIAAGNDHVDVVNTSPARTALQYNTIAVGAFDQRNCFSSYSNFGQGLSILAPGDNILSTYKNNSFAYMSGTSMASPCVAGVLAAYLTTLQNDALKETPKTLKQKLQSWATQASTKDNQIVSLRPGALTYSRSVYMKF